ncbi:LTA synthase family protein [Lentibacillus sediminis]|uniref:LTA synthase family protein n=1 Tax=Lentibacillus sediminis TaxID=1940529 RepID=UPI000C1C4578|nr:LTA synthase family protein [Lentibacillus sediminis]
MRKLTAFLSDHMIPAAALLLWLKTVIVTFIGFDLPVGSWWGVMLVILAPIGIIMLFLGCSFFFGKRVRPIAVFIILVLCTGLLYGNLLYYRFYIDFVTVSVLLQFDNVGGLGASTAELISPFDVLLFIDVILLGWIAFSAKRGKRTVAKPNTRKYGLTSIALIALTIGLGSIANPHALLTGYDREQQVASFGLFNYQLLNMAHSIKSPMEKVMADPSDTQKVSQYMEEREPENSKVFGLAEGKNVVMVSMESTQNFVINQTVNGEEITPFLNDLIHESFYFPNIYDQTAQGKTSDTEFMVDTGLYPLSSGSVFVRRPENEFNSLPHILNEDSGYTAASFHGNDREFWNREEMYQSLGYEEFFSKADYHVTAENSVNYGIKDIPFFEQSMDKLTGLNEPYMAKFITLTNHFPFLLEEEDQLIEPADTRVGVVDRYVTTVRYQDAALKRFFDMVKEAGMYEGTIFVLYGDHYGISEQYEAGVHELLEQEDTLLNHIKLQQVPLIIHIPGQEGRIINTAGGQIDIQATLLHLLGISTDDRVSFSHDLFTRDPEEPVVFRDGSMITDDYMYFNHTCYDRDAGETVESEHCAPYQEKAREELEMSDKIILGDLLRFME